MHLCGVRPHLSDPNYSDPNYYMVSDPICPFAHLSIQTPFVHLSYAEKVNFNALTDKQISDLRTLKEEIDAFNARITEIQFEQGKANLNE